MHDLVGADLVGRALDDHPAVVHHRHPLGDAERDVHVVLDEDQRDAPVEPEQQVGQELPLAAREPGGGLVEHQQLRLGGERHGERDLPMLAVRERSPTSSPSLCRDGDPAGGVARALADRASLPGQDHRPQVTAFDADDRRGRCCPRRSGRGTAATAGTCARARAWPGTRAGSCVTSSPEELDRARRRREVAGDDVEERRLAGAVRAEDRPTLAVGDVEIDVAHGVKAAEAPADPPQAEGRLGVLRRTVLLRSPTYLMTWLVTTPFLTTLILPCHGSFFFTQGGQVRPGAGLFGPNMPPNVWSTFGTKPMTDWCAALA